MGQTFSEHHKEMLTQSFHQLYKIFTHSYYDKESSVFYLYNIFDGTYITLTLKFFLGYEEYSYECLETAPNSPVGIYFMDGIKYKFSMNSNILYDMPDGLLELFCESMNPYNATYSSIAIKYFVELMMTYIQCKNIRNYNHIFLEYVKFLIFLQSTLEVVPNSFRPRYISDCVYCRYKLINPHIASIEFKVTFYYAERPSAILYPTRRNFEFYARNGFYNTNELLP